MCSATREQTIRFLRTFLGKDFLRTFSGIDKGGHRGNLL
jgi:hypothetical protein